MENDTKAVTRSLTQFEPFEVPAILVVSCDSYVDLWRPFFECFWKYWPDCPYPVFLGTGFFDFNHPRVNTVKYGKDISYSHNLAAMLDQVPHDNVIFWIEDRVISGPVDSERVEFLVRYAIAKDAAYLKLIPEHPMSYSAKDHLCGEIPRGTKYRSSMTVAYWRKRTLQGLLRPEESAWELERNGTVRSNGCSQLFLGLAPNLRSRPPIPHVHLVVKGRLTRDTLGFLNDERLRLLLSNRRIEPLRSYFYRLLYNIFWCLLRPVHHWWLLRHEVRHSGTP